MPLSASASSGVWSMWLVLEGKRVGVMDFPREKDEHTAWQHLNYWDRAARLQ